MMVENIKENGKIKNCMVLVYTNGKTENNIKENIKMIKSMDLVYISKLMEELLRAGGMMANNMALALLFSKTVSYDSSFFS